MSGILSHFVGEPRPQQVKALLEVEKHWDEADIFIIQAPVATGKSNIAITLSRWMFKEKHVRSNIIVPTNVLLQQYRSCFPKLNSIQRKDLYRCQNTLDSTDISEANCDYVSKLRGDDGKPEYCPSCCYLRAVRLAHKSPYMVANYWSYMALKLFKPAVIIDEAHNLPHVIRDLEGKRLWRKDYGYPSNVTNYQQLLDWVTKSPRLKTDKKLQLLKDELENGRQRYLVEKGFDLYRNHEQECLKLLPLDISNAKPYLWPAKKVQKIILMSATFSEVDLESLGLTGRRVCVIKTDSPIPIDRRPVIYKPIVNTSFAFQDTAVIKLAQFIKELADANPSTKGFVHCTYSFAVKLQRVLGGSRFIFHDTENKMELYNAWLKSDKSLGQVFIGCGLDEGIDLKGEEFGWQVVAKAQYANLSEPAIKYQAENSPKEYVWDAMRKCAQSCGRICRTVDDYGETYLVDSTFKKLFTQAASYGIVPDWLSEQIVNKEELYGSV
jgi:Rad3-related DNA helicase